MKSAEVIPLRCWQDPQGDVVLIYSERECSLFFACWSAAGEPADYICQLSFEHASSVRSLPREFVPYKEPEHSFHSYVLLIPDSDLYSEYAAFRKRRYPQHPGPRLNHYVVAGHDIYHEILAASFSETSIPVKELIDERLIRLHASA